MSWLELKYNGCCIGVLPRLIQRRSPLVSVVCLFNPSIIVLLVHAS